MKPLLLVLGGILVMTETLSGSRARTCPRGYVVCDGYLECDDSIDELPCGLTESIGYEYYYTSTVQVPGSQDKSLTISANVRFEVQKKNRINMVVFDAPKNVGADEDWKKTFVLMRGDDGRYDHIISNPTTSPVVLNIKKAMASVFQVTEPKGRNEYSVVETDVSGTCAQDYRVETSAEPFHQYLANRMETGIPKTITKTNDYSECSERPAQTRNYLETEDCSPERGSRIPMSKTITSCQVYLDAKGSLTIAQCITNETHAIPQAPDQGGNLNAIHVRLVTQ